MHKPKLLYISFWKFDYYESDGIAKKILSQITGMKYYGMDCFLLCSFNNRITIFHDEKIILTKEIKSSKIRYDFFNTVDEIKRLGIEYVYIRYPLSDFQFLVFLHKLNSFIKKINIEIPTYPYKGEIKIRYKYYVDYILASFLKKYVNKIAVFGDEKKVYGLKTLNINNCINKDLITLRTPEKLVPDIINVIGIGGMRSWHGFDRFLVGLKNYYSLEQTVKVIFHCVGDGPELKKYKEYVVVNNLNQYVVFYGELSGTCLDEIYNRCEVGIECLGAHRKKIYTSSSLKSREYIAKGIPIITSIKIDVIPLEYEFTLNIPATEEPIEIIKVVQFVENLRMRYSQCEIIERIRNDFLAKIDCINCMQVVVEDFLND